MNHILKKYCPRIEFDSYEDFYEYFNSGVPEAVYCGFDVVDDGARVEPEKRALVWCDDRDEERTFTFADLSRLSNQAANAFAKLGSGEGENLANSGRRVREDGFDTAIVADIHFVPEVAAIAAK